MLEQIMRILIKLPTKARKENFFSTLDKFYGLAENVDNLTFLITLDENDNIMNTDEVRQKLNSYKNLFYLYGNSKSKLDAANRDLEKFNDWDILLLASDDTVPVKKGYDRVIREKMIEFYPDTDGALHFNDGFQRDKLNTFPIVGKKYYTRFGYIQYPGYKSCFADNEFMEVSKLLKKITYFNEVIIQHQHPDWGFGQRDYAHIENIKNYNFDSTLFQSRKKNNFELKNI